MCDVWKEIAHLQKKYVTVETTNDVLKGYVHIIDPETGNIVLLSAGPIVHLIVAPTWIKVDICKGALPSDVPTSLYNLPRRDTGRGLARDVVLQGLRDRRIKADVVCPGDAPDDSGCVQGYISVFDGMARIVEPYGPLDVMCKTESVLSRIRQIVEQISREVSSAGNITSDTKQWPDETKRNIKNEVI